MLPIWTYWEGDRWPHIEACLAAMRRAWGDRLVVVTPETIPTYLPPNALHPRWREVPEIGPKTCCLRAALLHAHGGWWFDADTIPLGQPPAVIREELVYTAWTEPPWRVVSGYFGARAGSAVLADWIARIHRRLENFDEIGVWWLTLGERLLTPAVRAKPRNTRAVHVKTWLPLDFDRRPKRLIEPGDWRPYRSPETVCFALNHSWLAARHPALMLASPEAQAASPLLIHRLLCQARKIAKEGL